MVKKKEKSFKVYLFRHGQTYYNREHVFTGWKDSKLTPKGIKQAKIVAKMLKNKKFEVAYTNDLSRCKDTLKEVLKYHPEVKQKIVDKRLRERNYGALSGHHHSEFLKKMGEKDYKSLLHQHKIDHLHGKARIDFIKKQGEDDLQIVRRSYRNVPPKGESMVMVEKRVNSFLKDLIKKIKKEKINVAISASGNSMRPIRKYFEHLSIHEMMELENPWDNYFEYTVNIK
ncbi:MAG: histidine phosphatase family protein [Patescibacteria group bacterium]